MRLSSAAALLLLGALALPPPAPAEVTLSALFADHMVVQRGLPVHVWGDAEPGEGVTVTFRGAARATTADGLGRWSLHLPAGTAGGPFELTVQGANTLVLRDVLVGDVWLASGQSNMELPLRLAADPGREIAAADCPQVRFLQILPRPADHPLETLDAAAVRPWTPCRPENAAAFSAVAYHFAREIQQRTGAPVGIVQSCWGGTPAEAWTSLRTLAADPALLPVFAGRADIAAGRATFLRRFAQAQRAYARALAAGQAAGLTDPAQEWHPSFEGWAPGALYNGMIAPLTPFPLTGVIWYQGESNSEPWQFPIYDRLFPALIADWRHAWAQGDFPFLFVQLANFGRPPPEWHWPEVREAQRRSLRVANTAMVVTIDLGEAGEIHPKNKRDVGRRLALAARALAYGECLDYAGPLFRQATPDGGALRIQFDHTGGGLVGRGPAVTGFELAGADRQFVAANATIDGKSVLVSSPAVPAPRFVRYGWASDPACTLYNTAGLPASPFTSEN
jgi:sialate O-acetylesterase